MEQSEEKRNLAKLLQQQLNNCVGFKGDELESTRRQAYDYYFQRKRGDEIPGRSSIVSGDLSSMVEGNLAQMVEPLTNRRIAEFCAYGHDDQEQAQLESDFINHEIFEKQNGFIELACAIKDALLQRNAQIKVFIDERTSKEYVRRSNVPETVVTEVLDKIGDVAVHSYDRTTGKLSATIVKTTRKFCVEALAPENLLIPKNWHRQDLEGIPFCAERHVESRASLIGRGFPRSVVEQIPRWNNPYSSGGDARLPRNMTPFTTPLDKSQELVEWFECYVRMEASDGTDDLHRVCAADKFILESDYANVISYATGVAILNPHTFMGISLHDKLKGVQDSTTALTRALMDNLNATNKNRSAHLDGVVAAEDLTDGRTNGSIRVDPTRVADVRAAFTTFSVPDTSGNILMNLEHMRKSRSEMGGASLDMATGQMQLNDRVGSQGLDRAYSVMEVIAEMMIRVLANTLIRSMYLIAHETFRTEWQGTIEFKRANEWVKVEPSKWRKRDSLKVNLGKSKGERARISAVLDSLLAKQATLAQAGMEGVLVDVTTFYSAVMQWLRINDIDIPEQYVLDPRTPAAQQALKQKAVAREKAAAEQNSLAQTAAALEQLRCALDKYKTDAELQWKYYDTIIGAQIDEAKLATSAIVDIQKAKADATKARTNTGTEEGASGPVEKQSDTGGSAE